jgi:hypothetical protein
MPSGSIHYLFRTYSICSIDLLEKFILQIAGPWGFLKGGSPMLPGPCLPEIALITAWFPFDNGFTDRTPHHYCRHAIRVFALISYIAYQIMNAQSEAAIFAYLCI